jgi:hypothetical protein
MLRNQAVRNQVFPGANQPSIVTQDGLNAMLASEGLPPFTMYQSQVNQNKVATKVMPDNVLLFLPPAVDGTEDQGDGRGHAARRHLLGHHGRGMDPRFGVDEDDLPGLVAGEYTEEDPISVWTKVASINLPVMPNPNLSFAATVA